MSGLPRTWALFLSRRLNRQHGGESLRQAMRSIICAASVAKWIAGAIKRPCEASKSPI
jgi:hypothetical protein